VRTKAGRLAEMGIGDQQHLLFFPESRALREQQKMVLLYGMPG
jgi:hypothetical protein